MNVGDWLRELGLSQYEAVFRDNEIDGSVLPKLTAEDLKELGVASIGHRRKILSAIEALSAWVSSPGAVAVQPQPPKNEAERRQLTVMFCDLVGSTALSTRLDPEDMSRLIRAFQSAVSAATARFDGWVAKFMGDGALIYFGYPSAHEDDAERAARAGLAILEAVKSIKASHDVGLLARAGIATGLVVVGEVMGEGEARERSVVGETPNLAARLQALAEPGGIVVAASTRRLLGETFELRSLGPQSLKGFLAPVPAWAIMRESEGLSRFEASRSESMTPLVGREQEVALLLDRWRDAAAGEGQVVLLSGEPGIGKSRLLEALRERVNTEPHFVLRYQCSPHYVADAFYPIIGQLWRAAELKSGEPATVCLGKLEALVARSRLDPQKIVPYLASILSITAEGSNPVPDIRQSDGREGAIAALIELFVKLTEEAPVVAFLEDAHWIDAATLDLFNRLVDQLPRLRALLAITFRPEFVAPWLGRAHVATLPLNRLASRHSAALVLRVTRGKALPTEIFEQIVAKTEGVPLFVEELTKTVLESGQLRLEKGAYVAMTPFTPLAIPSSLQDSLAARLDRLGDAKEIAQIGATIGREFSHRLLEAVSPISGPALAEAIGKLLVSELIYAKGTQPETTYVFKHALVRDTAYSSLLRSRRQLIHADIARALEEPLANTRDSRPAIIAHHYTEAGMRQLAFRHWATVARMSFGARPRPKPADSNAPN
jgi:class 3 adenylate cyclase